MKVKFEVRYFPDIIHIIFDTWALLEHKIQGDSLCELDSDALKTLGITSAGRRLSILRSIYLVKVAHSVPIDETHYIPPCLCTVSHTSANG
jgi:hypothetical protein